MVIELLKASGVDSLEMIEFEKASSSKFFHAFTDSHGMVKYLEDSIVYFILMDNTKVGAIGYEKINKELAQIQGLNILPKYRNRNIGTNAVKELEKKIIQNGFKEANLMVHPENTIAIITYMKCGFSIKSWKENYFGDGEPRLEMWKKF